MRAETGLTIGQLMHAQRKRLGLSMKKLAQKLGVCEKTISNWERNIGVFPADLLVPVCRALRLTPSQILGIESDLDDALKLQQVREVCQAIGQITARIRNIPDLAKVTEWLIQRDRLRHQLRELLGLPPLEGDTAAELKRTEQWHQKKPTTKHALYERYFHSFKVLRPAHWQHLSKSLFTPLTSRIT